MPDKTITISLERYTELLKKEMGYEYRRAELQLKEEAWVTEADKIIFGLLKDRIPVGSINTKDDDF